MTQTATFEVLVFRRENDALDLVSRLPALNASSAIAAAHHAAWAFAGAAAISVSGDGDGRAISVLATTGQMPEGEALADLMMATA